ncbi:uncharacterized protein LOC130679981 [Manis pentadactyla]|nr:uncharacterized protein LOC130679981 [Manis pentadactyla]
MNACSPQAAGISISPGSHRLELEPRQLEVCCEPCGRPGFGARPLRRPGPDAQRRTVVGNGGALLAGTLAHLLPAAQGSSPGHPGASASHSATPWIPVPTQVQFPRKQLHPGTLLVSVSPTPSGPWQGPLKCGGCGGLPGRWPEDLRPWQHLPEHPSLAPPLQARAGPAHLPSTPPRWSARTPKGQPYCPPVVSAVLGVGRVSQGTG